MTASPQLAAALPRAQQLTELGTLGLEAVGYLSSGVAAPPGWKARQLAILDRGGEAGGDDAVHGAEAAAGPGERGEVREAE